MLIFSLLAALGTVATAIPLDSTSVAEANVIERAMNPEYAS